MLNRIVNLGNNFCIICFSSIYQDSITLISIPKFHRNSTNISLHPFILKNNSHYITPIQIILFIQPHTHILKQIIFFYSHNQQTKKIRTQKKGKQNTRLQKQRKTKYQIIETKRIPSKKFSVTLHKKTCSNTMLNNPSK